MAVVFTPYKKRFGADGAKFTPCKKCPGLPGTEIYIM